MKRFRTLALVFIGYAFFFLFTFPPFYFFLLFCIGLFIGYTFHILDRLCQLIFISDFNAEKKHFFALIKTKKISESVLFLVGKIPSITHSFHFLLLYFPLTIYVITSTGSVIGVGIVLGLGLSYSIHFILGYKHLESIRELFFKPLKKSVTNEDIKKIMGVFIIVFFCLSLFALF